MQTKHCPEPRIGLLRDTSKTTSSGKRRTTSVQEDGNGGSSAAGVGSAMQRSSLNYRCAIIRDEGNKMGSLMEERN